MTMMKKEKDISIEMSETELGKILLEYFRGKNVVGAGIFAASVTARSQSYPTVFVFSAIETITGQSMESFKEPDLKALEQKTVVSETKPPDAGHQNPIGQLELDP